jgi:hypothetical protein
MRAKKIRVKKHKRKKKNYPGYSIVRSHFRKLKSSRDLKEKMRCFNCKSILSFQDFTKRNPNIPIERLRKLWENPKIQLYCCKCFAKAQREDLPSQSGKQLDLTGKVVENPFAIRDVIDDMIDHWMFSEEREPEIRKIRSWKGIAAALKSVMGAAEGEESFKGLDHFVHIPEIRKFFSDHEILVQAEYAEKLFGEDNIRELLKEKYNLDYY